MYVIFATQTPYGKRIFMHRQIMLSSDIAERHVKRLNATNVGQGKRKKPLIWSWSTPEWFQAQLDRGRMYK